MVKLKKEGEQKTNHKTLGAKTLHSCLTLTDKAAEARRPFPIDLEYASKR